MVTSLTSTTVTTVWLEPVLSVITEEVWLWVSDSTTEVCSWTSVEELELLSVWVVTSSSVFTTCSETFTIF